MATVIPMRHKTSGILKNGFYGFSWTTLFFGCFPALFRADFLTFVSSFVVLILLALITNGVGWFVAFPGWAFFYNNYFTKRLLENGYEFASSQSENAAAEQALGIFVTSSQSIQKPFRPTSSQTATLSDDAYKIYLVKKYQVEFNDVFKKYIFNNAFYENVEDALSVCHEIELAEIKRADEMKFSDEKQQPSEGFRRRHS